MGVFYWLKIMGLFTIGIYIGVNQIAWAIGSKRKTCHEFIARVQ